MRAFIKFLKYLFYLLLAALILGLVTVFIVFHFFSNDLPDHSSLNKYFPDVSSRVFLLDGTKLCEFSNERRYFIPIEKIPKKLSNAFIAAEDQYFYDHIGIDIIGIGRSLIKNIENLGKKKRPQGASTITQQVARILLIKNNEISYVRKIKEAILALRMEETLSKKKILELYLNQIFLGMGTYGVAAAAKTYFNKTVDELTLGECSYLAALAKGANNYHPTKNRERAIERRNWVIYRQLEDGFITEKEAADAQHENLVMVPQKRTISNADYFSEEVRKWLLNKFPIASLNKYGLIIRATLNPKIQQYAYVALRKGLKRIDRNFGWRGPLGKISVKEGNRYIAEKLKTIKKPKGAEEAKLAVIISKNTENIVILTEDSIKGRISAEDVKWIKHKASVGMVILVSDKDRDRTYDIFQLPKVQGAIVVIEANSGRILAMQGGYSFQQSEFNRATQAMRQSGSAFKPFVYLTALENGFSPNTVIDSKNVEIDLGERLGIWKPKNYGKEQVNNITFRNALERSINTATVRIAQETGMDKIVQVAEKFNIFDKMPPYLAYSLGAGETTLLRLSAAYAMLANGGKRVKPTMVDYILDKYGNVMYKSDNRSVNDEIGFDAEYPPKLEDMREQVVDERSAYQITSILEGSVLRKTEFKHDYAVAGKTGTSNDSRDAWFIGYTPDIVVGVFIGFDDQTKNLGEKATGRTMAFPVFCDFMSNAKHLFKPKPFRVPKGIKLKIIDSESGGKPIKNKKTIVEAFKEEDEFTNKIVAPKFPQQIIDLVNEKDYSETEQDTDLQKIKPIIGIY